MSKSCRLLIMRHAKAEQGEGEDHERALAPRGRRDAAKMGRWLQEHVGRPDVVWCSTALRAKQTWLAAAGALAGAPEARYRRSIYLAGADELIDLVHDAPAEAGSLLLVGHNPSMQQLLADLTGDDRRFPTGAVAVVELGSWARAEPGAARLADFAAPREL